MIKKILFLGLLAILLPKVVSAASCGDTCHNNDECTQVINDCNNQITSLQSQADTLKKQISQFNVQIALTGAKIEQTKQQIELLSGRIDQVSSSLENLKNAFSARAVETYKMARVDGPIFLLLSASNLNSVISNFHYLEEAQNADRNLLDKLQNAQTTYENSKKQSEDLQKELQNDENLLNSQKAAKQTLLAQTQGSESNYQRLLAQAQAQLSAFRNFVTSQGGASILSNQTVCNDWGCYYNQRDSQWGNKFMGNSALSVAEYGCLVSSSAMVATFYKKNLNPGDIAGNPSAFFSPDSSTALLWRDITVNGVHIVRTSVSPTTANIDSELSAGRPVIVGLYSGPAHFIVIKSGSNGNYIMNDPFMENGHDVSFTSKYSVANISDVESVSIN